MLDNDQNVRIQLKDALKHPWIKNREHLKNFIGVNRNKENTKYLQHQTN